MDIQSIKNKFGIIGTSPSLNRAIEMAVRVAPTDLSVLITGESGVGKEVFPQIIHQFSSRKHSRYIAVNCGAIPEGTIDSELFGHEKGSFTGAHEARKGYFEEANGGTIFLDEVAELPITTQVRLLRVLQSGEFMKVGSSKAQKTDVRVVAATNIDLIKAIEIGRFREDLYYRLNTVPIAIPPLRERKEDIFLLFKKFASDLAVQYRLAPISIDGGAKNMLEQYYFAGNIRQLKNVAEQIATIEQGKEINKDILINYLPNYDPNNLPILHPTNGGAGSRDFSTERDILYKLLYELRGEVSELKGMMRQISGTNMSSVGTTNVQAGVSSIKPAIVYNPSLDNSPDDQEFSEAEEVVDMPTERQFKNKREAQKSEIIEALERNGGRRKETAAELFISERTLYRKIKELGIE